MKDPKIVAINKLRRANYQRLTKPVEATWPKPGQCEICGKISANRSLARDHDHLSGKFRGWICSSCNMGLGYFQDSPRALRRAADYITAHLI
jgi:hypothetical protein